jgi:hypothetical protein
MLVGVDVDIVNHKASAASMLSEPINNEIKPLVCFLVVNGEPFSGHSLQAKLFMNPMFNSERCCVR